MLYLCLLREVIIYLVRLWGLFIKNVEHTKDFYHLVKGQMLAMTLFKKRKELQNGMLEKDIDIHSVQPELFTGRET